MLTLRQSVNSTVYASPHRRRINSELNKIIVTWSAWATCVQADLCLCDPVVEGVAGAFEVEDALGTGAVAEGVAGAFEVEDAPGAGAVEEGVAGAFEVEDTLGAGAVAEGVAGAFEVEDALGAGAVEEGVLGVNTEAGDEDTVGSGDTGENGVAAGAGVADALGEDSVNVIFLTTPSGGSE